MLLVATTAGGDVVFSKNTKRCTYAVREFLDPKTLNAKYTQTVKMVVQILN
jgi:hypothetical protein